jgi:hypothetical protein
MKLSSHFKKNKALYPVNLLFVKESILQQDTNKLSIRAYPLPKINSSEYWSDNFHKKIL